MLKEDWRVEVAYKRDRSLQAQMMEFFLMLILAGLAWSGAYMWHLITGVSVFDSLLRNSVHSFWLS